jgi:hypothetical protein
MRLAIHCLCSRNPGWIFAYEVSSLSFAHCGRERWLAPSLQGKVRGEKGTVCTSPVFLPFLLETLEVSQFPPSSSTRPLLNCPGTRREELQQEKCTLYRDPALEMDLPYGMP